MILVLFGLPLTTVRLFIINFIISKTVNHLYNLNKNPNTMKCIFLTILSMVTFVFNSLSQGKIIKETDHIIEYRGWVLNSNVALPAIRFNMFKEEPADNKSVGSIEYFNSAGAGISFNFGKIKVTSIKPFATKEEDENEGDLETRFTNYIGFSLGVLFSQNNNDGITRSIFAPTIGVQVLDFQLGLGLELGTLSPEYRRAFVTIAYSIPISKLTNWGGLVLTNPKSPKHAGTKVQGNLF